MKNLLLSLFLVSLLYGQSKYLQGADNTLEVSSAGKYFVVQVNDSADTFTDTLEVKVYSMLTNSFVTIGLQDLYAGDYVTSIIPGDGLTKRYLVNEPYPTKIQVIRKNTANTSRRTFVWVIAKYGF